MIQFLEIAKYVIPSLIVFLTAYFTISSFMKNEEKKRKLELLLNTRRVITPVRLQAYERAVLFLERISPDSMLTRLHKKDMTAGDLQSRMLATIRAEFEHNFTQQVYMSHDSWQMIIKAKENTVKLINTVASEIKKEAPSIILSKALLEHIMEIPKTPSATAIEFLKKEIQLLF